MDHIPESVRKATDSRTDAVFAGAWYTSRPDPVNEFLATKISAVAVEEFGKGKETSSPGAM